MDIKNTPEKLLAPYKPQDTEQRIYSMWEESGFFNPDVCIEKGIAEADAPTFSMVLPPPNVTGTLHTGHALMLVIQDIMTRFARMQGKRTLWLPGTDHAAIATQSKVEKILEKDEGKRKQDLGREEFLKRVDAFAQESHDTIVNQARRMGASLDWSREAFTLDEARNLAVRTAFKKMYEDGLIYRGHRIVNWDPKGQTVISDDEIVYEERKAKLYTFKYSKDFPISISTTRPETKVGDTAVAVNPTDERYMQYIGKEYDAVFCGVPIHIKIIGDDAVEKDFGTGALGVTPAHSQIDAEMATRHNIPTVQVINEFAKMMVGGENLLGKKVSEAKEIIVAWLNEEGLMEKEEDISQNVSTAERTGAIIEPLPKLQWFINVNKPIADRGNKTLKELMLGVVESKQVNILPDRYENVYYNWIRNLRDWCISRQIWYGHRIPVWYCIHCKMPHVELKPQANIYLIRHGQTDDNVNKIVAGSLTDTPLNEEGKKQAAAAGETIRNAKIDYIISSDMTRTRQTAEIIQSIAGGEIILDNELRERSYGVLEGTTFGSPAEKKDTKSVYGYHGKPENGESYKDVEDRVYNTFANHFNALEGKNVVFVTHGGSIRTLLRRLNNITEQEALDQKGVENATLLKLEVGPKCSDCGHKLYEQDPDTLDTWFSSGLWTFSTLGWPNQTDDLKNYHPTNVLETGHDILFFWVARMILMSTYLLGEVPFKTAYLHGLVRDEKGRKMSKSLGNIVDPLTLIDKYGTDALRMAMIVGVGPGSDSNLGEDKIKAYSKFANKLWNISRFVLENAGDANMDAAFDEEDQKSFDDLTALVSEVTKEMEEFKFYLVAEKLYHFAWHEFADIIIERCKTKIAEDNNAESAKKLLATILPILLKTLHPFMPYVTEELWSLLPATSGRMLMVEKWPC